MTKLAPPKPSTWRPSAKPSYDPIRPTNNRSLCDKKAHYQALKAANRLLAKAGYFTKPELKDQEAIDPDSIGQHGLKPTWHGRA